MSRRQSRGSGRSTKAGRGSADRESRRRAAPRPRDSLRDTAVVIAALSSIVLIFNLQPYLSFWGYRFLIGVVAFFLWFFVIYGLGKLLHRAISRFQSRGRPSRP